MEQFKKWGSLIIVVLVTQTMLTGCLPQTKRVKAETILDAYYTYIANENYSALMDLINPIYCESFGGGNELEQRLQSHRKLMGENESYTIISKESDEINTVFETKVTYDDSVENQTVTITIDENAATISELDFERPPYVNKMAEDFFTAYRLGDFQTIYRYLHPTFYDYATEEELSNVLVQLEAKAGEFRAYMLKEEAFYCIKSETLPTTIYTGVYIVSYEKISIYVEIELCEENDVIGINFIGFDFIEE